MKSTIYLNSTNGISKNRRLYILNENNEYIAYKALIIKRNSVVIRKWRWYDTFISNLIGILKKSFKTR